MREFEITRARKSDAEALTADLMNQVFTIRTADIQKDNFFANRKKKD